MGKGPVRHLFFPRSDLPTMVLPGEVMIMKKMNKLQNIRKSLMKHKKDFVFIPKSLMNELTKSNEFINSSNYEAIQKVDYPILKADGTISKRKKIIYESRIARDGEIGEIYSKRIIVK